MTGDQKLARHRVAEGRLQKCARFLDKQMPAGIRFALVTFTFGDGGYAGYVSSARREDMIKALRECADNLEAKALVKELPP